MSAIIEFEQICYELVVMGAGVFVRRTASFDVMCSVDIPLGWG